MSRLSDKKMASPFKEEDAASFAKEGRVLSRNKAREFLNSHKEEMLKRMRLQEAGESLEQEITEFPWRAWIAGMNRIGSMERMNPRKACNLGGEVAGVGR
jgi:hypothetical protein